MKDGFGKKKEGEERMKYLKKWKRLIAALLCVFIITQSMPQLVIATEIVQSDAQDAEETSVSEEEAAVLSTENSTPEVSTETEETTTVDETSVETTEEVTEEAENIEDTKIKKASKSKEEDIALLADDGGTTIATQKTVQLQLACEQKLSANVTVKSGGTVLKDADNKEIKNREIKSENGMSISFPTDQGLTIELEVPEGIGITSVTTESNTKVGSVEQDSTVATMTLSQKEVAALEGSSLTLHAEYKTLIALQASDELDFSQVTGTIKTAYIAKHWIENDRDYKSANFETGENGKAGIAIDTDALESDTNQMEINLSNMRGLKIVNAEFVKRDGTSGTFKPEISCSDSSITIKSDNIASGLKDEAYVLAIQVEPITSFSLTYNQESGFVESESSKILNSKVGKVTFFTYQVTDKETGTKKDMTGVTIEGKNSYYVANFSGSKYLDRTPGNKNPNKYYNVVDDEDTSFGKKQTVTYTNGSDSFDGERVLSITMQKDTTAPEVKIEDITYQEGNQTETPVTEGTSDKKVYVTDGKEVQIRLSAFDRQTSANKEYGIGVDTTTDAESKPIAITCANEDKTLNGTVQILDIDDTEQKANDIQVTLNNLTGTNTFYISVPDKFGNTATIPITVCVDNTAPILADDDTAVKADGFNMVSKDADTSYWIGSTTDPALLLNVKEENDVVNASYSVSRVEADGTLAEIGSVNNISLDKAANEDNPRAEEGYVIRRMPIDLRRIFGCNSLNKVDEGIYVLKAELTDITEKNTSSYTLSKFEINRQKPLISISQSYKEAHWTNSAKEAVTVSAEIQFFSVSSQENYSYAVTSAFGNDIFQENPSDPSDDEKITILNKDIENGKVTVKAELPVDEYADKDGTVRFYIWVYDKTLDTKNSQAVTYHIDNTQPEITSVKAEKSSENDSLKGRIYRYIFGTALSDEETLKFTISANDKAADGAVYLTDDQPEIQKVSLYYILADDSEVSKMSVSEQYQWLNANNVKEETVNASENADGTYTAELKVKEKNKFYKLYVLAKDKAGNITIKSVAQLTENQDEYSISQIMVDNKKPEIKTSLQKDSKADYTEKRDGKEYNWYAASSAINYDVTVKDAQSGIFSVEAQVNGSTLKKDANGTKFYDSNSYYQKNKADKMKLETKFTYVVNLKQGNLGKDGQSTIQIDVADNAGNTNSVKNVVYVDENAPVISHMEFDTGAKDDLSTVPTQYGYFFQKATNVTVYATDYIGDSDIIGSGVAKIGYQLNPADGSEPISGELEATANADGTYTAQFAIPEGFKGQIEVKAIDHVGQDSGFYNPKGAVVETAEEHAATSDAKILLPETEYADAEGNPLYASDVTLQLVTADGRSGLKENNWSVKEHYAADALAGGTLQVTSVFDEASRTWSSVCDGDADWSIPNALDLNLVTSAQKNVVVASDTNHIEAALQITDNAGNVSGAEGKTFSIDKTAPVVTVEYDNNNVLNEKYYKEKRTATITVVDANFSEENCTFDITGPNANVSGWTHHAAAGCDGTVHTAECYYTCQVEFVEDGDYKFDFHCTDRAGHTAGMQAPDEFTIDTAVPVISVSYDNNAGNANYYSEARTATIEINDKNFNPATTQVDVTASLEGNGISVPQPSAFTQNGDVWTASVNFSADGDYSLHVTSTDQAGNEAEEYALEEFTVDTTVPEVTISGVEDHSANQGTVAPTIQCSDINMNTDSISVTLTGANNGATAFESSRTVTGSEATISIADIQHTEEMDDLYTLEVSVQDQAGNETVESVLFSVNRFGSVYVVDDKTKTLVDNFYTNQEQDVIITEVNVDILQYSEIDYSLDGDIVTLEKDKDYTVTSKTDEASWKMYEYCIDKSNFEKEGSYVVSVYSEDLAQNKSSNKAKGEELAFVVDKTAPTIVIAGVEDNGQYMDAKRNVTIDTQDNILLDNVEVYVGDTKKAAAGQDELLESDGQISLGIDGANKSQELYVVAKDAAGNIAKSENIRFLITKNVLVQWYSNVPLCVGSSTAAVGITGLVVFRKRIPFRNLKHVVKGRK